MQTATQQYGRLPSSMTLEQFNSLPRYAREALEIQGNEIRRLRELRNLPLPTPLPVTEEN